MKAMILAAGFGKRMRPLTNCLPKPLLPVAGRSLIEYQIERLAVAGIRDIVINISYMGDKIQAHLGDGEKLGVSIHYSPEAEPLETAGAIACAMSLLRDNPHDNEPFVVINGDVWCDFLLEKLVQYPLPVDQLGHLLFVPNPEFKTKGDFCLVDDIKVQHCDNATEGYTFAGISLLRPSLIMSYPQLREAFSLKEVFDWAITKQALTAQVYRGDWRDIGTPQRLQELEQFLQNEK